MAQKAFTQKFEFLNNRLFRNIQLHCILEALMASFRKTSVAIKPLMSRKDRLERDARDQPKQEHLP